MRVISGTLGGRRLLPPEGRRTRPTTDRVREALFARLASRYVLEGARILDLFAGTGALAIEALSRGAAAAVAVEADRRTAAVLRRNVAALGLDAAVRVVIDDFRRAVARLAEAGEIFDGVLIDAPYGSGLGEHAVRALTEAGALAEAAWVSVETGTGEELPAAVGPLVRVREDRYGDTKLTLYEREPLAGESG